MTYTKSPLDSKTLRGLAVALIAMLIRALLGDVPGDEAAVLATEIVQLAATLYAAWGRYVATDTLKL